MKILTLLEVGSGKTARLHTFKDTHKKINDFELIFDLIYFQKLELDIKIGIGPSIQKRKVSIDENGMLQEQMDNFSSKYFSCLSMNDLISRVEYNVLEIINKKLFDLFKKNGMLLTKIIYNKKLKTIKLVINDKIGPSYYRIEKNKFFWHPIVESQYDNKIFYDLPQSINNILNVSYSPYELGVVNGL